MVALLFCPMPTNSDAAIAACRVQAILPGEIMANRAHEIRKYLPYRQKTEQKQGTTDDQEYSRHAAHELEWTADKNGGAEAPP